MRIVHIAPNAPYNEGWSYQENLLPKYQKRLGHDVTIIATNLMHHDGGLVHTEQIDKIQDDGVRLIRIASGYSQPRNRLDYIRAPMKIYDLLCSLMPDYVFFHGLVSVSILQVVRYKTKHNPRCIIVQDNHFDYVIGRHVDGLKSLLVRSFYRHLVRISIKYIDKVYGVTPWRKTYAEDYFKVPKSKTDILIMGADDDVMDMGNRDMHRKAIRDKYRIKDNEFLIVSGGKLEDNKNIDLLIEACGTLKGIKLLLFGSVDKKIEVKFNELIQKYPHTIYIGWIDSKDCYKYFYASDLVCFPGRHSVLWEQACASKVPCLIKKWDGMDHVDVGGNVLLLDNVSIISLRDTIKSLSFSERYGKMLSVAQSSLTDVFLYSGIAQKSISDFFPTKTI